MHRAWYTERSGLAKEAYEQEGHQCGVFVDCDDTDQPSGMGILGGGVEMKRPEAVEDAIKQQSDRDFVLLSWVFLLEDGLQHSLFCFDPACKKCNEWADKFEGAEAQRLLRKERVAVRRQQAASVKSRRSNKRA